MPVIEISKYSFMQNHAQSVYWKEFLVTILSLKDGPDQLKRLDYISFSLEHVVFNYFDRKPMVYSICAEARRPLENAIRDAGLRMVKQGLVEMVDTLYNTTDFKTQLQLAGVKSIAVKMIESSARPTPSRTSSLKTTSLFTITNTSL